MDRAARARRRAGTVPVCLDCGTTFPRRPGKRSPKRCDPCRAAHLTAWHRAYWQARRASRAKAA
jgi:hypothetical protein